MSDKAVCGIVMPISEIDGCNKEHWSEVLDILSEVIEEAGFEPNLVSNGDDVGIIQKRIIQNLYENPIVVCDVSGKNPNVMFELGLRLAFDKPTIIVKDDRTSYSFDTSPIEHLEYPRDLRFTKIVEFKALLTDKIVATHKRSVEDRSFTTFLKNFGEFKTAVLNQKEVPGQEYMLDEIRALTSVVRRLERSSRRPSYKVTGEVDVCLGRKATHDPQRALEAALSQAGCRDAIIRQLGPEHVHVLAYLDPNFEVEQSAFIKAVLDGSRMKVVGDRKVN
jgi:hypothetical protein